MKYIIILLTSLFLVSNASADNTIKVICEKTILGLSNLEDMKLNIIKEMQEYKWDAPETKKFLKQLDEINASRLESAKLYHYLDCREELGR